MEADRRISSTTVDLSADKSMTGTVNFGRFLGFGPGRFSGGWWKKLGMVVTPESTNPFTPIFDSSNFFTSDRRS